MTIKKSVQENLNLLKRFDKILDNAKNETVRIKKIRERKNHNVRTIWF